MCAAQGWECTGGLSGLAGAPGASREIYIFLYYVNVKVLCGKCNALICFNMPSNHRITYLNIL